MRLPPPFRLPPELAALIADGSTVPTETAARLKEAGVRFDDYIAVGGTYYQPHDPKLVLIPPIERTSGDCHCPCKRFMLPLRVAEGTTIHSLQGINVGHN